MDITTMTAQEIMFYSILINTAIGFLLGLIPLISGFKKQNRRLGFFGFGCSILGGALLGIYLSVPVAGLFTWLIIKKAKDSAANEFRPADNSPQNPGS